MSTHSILILTQVKCCLQSRLWKVFCLHEFSFGQMDRERGIAGNISLELSRCIKLVELSPVRPDTILKSNCVSSTELTLGFEGLIHRTPVTDRFTDGKLQKWFKLVIRLLFCETQYNIKIFKFRNPRFTQIVPAKIQFQDDMISNNGKRSII